LLSKILVLMANGMHDVCVLLISVAVFQVTHLGNEVPWEWN
jgi:hypothetical protein